MQIWAIVTCKHTEGERQVHSANCDVNADGEEGSRPVMKTGREGQGQSWSIVTCGHNKGDGQDQSQAFTCLQTGREGQAQSWAIVMCRHLKAGRGWVWSWPIATCVTTSNNALPSS